MVDDAVVEKSKVLVALPVVGLEAMNGMSAHGYARVGARNSGDGFDAGGGPISGPKNQ
jgi:hypothetical protein